MNINLTVPTQWKELNKKQLLFVAEVSMMHLTRQEILFTLFCRFANVKLQYKSDVITLKRKRQTFTIDPQELRFFCNKLNVFIDEKPTEMLNLTGVNDHLIGVPFQNYYAANALFHRYTVSRNLKFFRTGYKSLTGSFFLGNRKKAEVILFWWGTVQNYLKEKYPLVFEGATSNNGIFNPADQLNEILLMVTQKQPHLNKEILNSETNAVLLAMNEHIREVRELEKIKNKK